MSRPPRPDDLYRFRIPTDPQLSPSGELVAMTVQVVAPSRDAYRHAIWLVPSDGSAPPRQATLGVRNDTHPRFSPDGRWLAFLSDRRPVTEEEPEAPKDREDGTQVHLLPLDGGEARRLTDLPRGVEGFAWSPDGRWLVVRSASAGPTREEDARVRGKGVPPKPGEPPTSDYRYLDRLQNMLNGPGFIYDHVEQPVARRGCHRRRAAADHGPHEPRGPGLLPGRHPRRLRGPGWPRPGPRLAVRRPRGGCRERPRRPHLGRRRLGVRDARLAGGWTDGGRAGPPVPAGRGEPQRHLAVRRGRQRGREGRGPQPLRPP